MSSSLIIILNIINYVVFLSILNNFFINKFYYPFRKLELINFFINILIFGYITFIFFEIDIFFLTIILNINLAYIFFHIQNMINTSPRTRILLDLHLNKDIKKYNDKIILDNRIKRLLSTKQIIVDDHSIQINKKKFLFKLINFIFRLIKKF
tara:strand:- start:8 stop:463 length:456 start_codon:yes stop_codon:yes gene_type:complete